MPRKILIDTDPGIDDAMAIYLALRSPELDLVGLTTVFGNAPVEICTRNALALLEIAERPEIPVARGAACALVRPPHPAPVEVHGADGLGNVDLPAPAGAPLPIPAAQFIVETILAHPGEVTLAPIGPLTNLALAARLEPRIVDLVDEVVLMGGAAFVPGNVNPVAEANIWNDPEAAGIVFGAGWKVTMVGLDVTHQAAMDAAYLSRLEACENPLTKLIGRIAPFYQHAHEWLYDMHGAIHTHDPSVIARLIDPSIFRTQSLPIYVETAGRCAGQTIPDPARQWGDAPLADVCVAVDAPRLLELYWQRMTGEI